MKSTAKPAWDRLADALLDTTPDCADDDRYIADTLDRVDKATMAAICAACPLLDPCRDYAIDDQPRGGWWPGVQLKLQRKEAA